MSKRGLAGRQQPRTIEEVARAACSTTTPPALAMSGFSMPQTVQPRHPIPNQPQPAESRSRSCDPLDGQDVAATVRFAARAAPAVDRERHVMHPLGISDRSRHRFARVPPDDHAVVIHERHDGPDPK